MHRKLLLMTFFFISFFFVGVVDVQGSHYDTCEIKVNCPSGQEIGGVTEDGHFHENPDVGTHELCCNPSYVNFPAGNGGASTAFRWSNASGNQGHVQAPSQTPKYEFNQTIDFGQDAKATKIVGSVDNTLDSNDLCLFRMSNKSNAHIADCQNPSTQPGGYDASGYDYVLSNPTTEVCDNNVSDNGNGDVDCADSYCNQVSTADLAKECTGNNQTHDDCWDESKGEFKDHCKNSSGAVFYCSYGEEDDPEESSNDKGYCCPEGQRAFYGPSGSFQGCQDASVCHDVDDPLSSVCKAQFDPDAENADWWNKYEFSGDTSNLCYSNRNGTQAGSSGDRYYEPADVSYNQSGACCNISQYGNENYYWNEENVKVWG